MTSISRVRIVTSFLLFPHIIHTILLLSLPGQDTSGIYVRLVLDLLPAYLQTLRPDNPIFEFTLDHAERRGGKPLGFPQSRRYRLDSSGCSDHPSFTFHLQQEQGDKSCFHISVAVVAGEDSVCGHLYATIKSSLRLIFHMCAHGVAEM